MAEHITIPQDTELGRLVRTVVSQGQVFRDQLSLLAIALETRLIGADDFTLIESSLGGLQAGLGLEVYTMITGARNALYSVGDAAAVKYGADKLLEMHRRLGI